MTNPVRVLCVEADGLMQLEMGRLPERHATFPMTVTIAANCDEALQDVTRSTPDVICIAVEGLDGSLMSDSRVLDLGRQQVVGDVADLLWDVPAVCRTRGLTPPYIILLTNRFSTPLIEDRFVPLGASAVIHRDHFRADCPHLLQEVMRGPRPILPSASVVVVHAQPDLKRAERIYDRLRDAYFRPWIGTRDVHAGRNLRDSVAEAIGASDFCLICLSRQSGGPGEFQRNLTIALDRSKAIPSQETFLIPAKLGRCPVPDPLQDLQIVDLFAKGGWRSLVRALRASVERRARARPPSRGARVLVLDSDRDWCDELRKWLVGCDVWVATTADEALRLLTMRDFGFVIVDVDLDSTMGLGVLKTLQSCTTPAVVLATTNFDNPTLAKESRRLGVHEYLVKDRLIAQRIAVRIRHRIDRSAPEAGS